MEKSRALLYLESEELRNGVIGNYFTASCSLNEFEFRSDGLFIKVFVDAEVRYANRPQNYYFSNDVDALIVKENGQLRISDILFYETVMPELPALSTNRWDSRVNPTAVSEKLNQMESEIASSKYMFENIDEYLAEWQSDAELEIAERNVLKEKDPNTTIRATYSFNRSNMVSYARTTAPLKKHTDNRLYKDSNHTVSARGSSQAPYYYDFSSLSNAYDCTNFASHVLLSGGAKIKNNGVSAPNTTNGGGWYFNNANPPGPTSRSESWAGADAFGTFLLYNTGNGPRAVQALYPLKSHMALGDVIQWRYSNYGYPGYGHTTIITAWRSADNYPLITSRTSSTTRKVDQDFFEKLNESGVLGYRLIALTGHVY